MAKEKKEKPAKKGKKKLLIIIIIAVVVLVGAFLALFFLGLLPFGAGADSASSTSGASSPSSMAAASGSMAATSGSMATTSGSMAPTSGSMATTDGAAMPEGNPERFFEGEFYFQNITGAPLVEIHLAPTGTSSWESNLLDETTLENGETWAVPLMMRDLGTTWDLRTTDSNGQELLYSGLDFYTNTKFVLTLEGDSPSLRQAP